VSKNEEKGYRNATWAAATFAALAAD